MATQAAPVKRGRGRPPGSKNKNTAEGKGKGRGRGGRGGAQQVEEVQFSQQRVVEAQSDYDSLSYEAYQR